MHYAKEIRRTTRAISKLRNPGPLMNEANKQFSKSGILNEIVSQRFDSGGRSSGRAWKPLAKRTIQDRKRMGFPSGPPLKRSSTLKFAAALGVMKYNKAGVSMTYRKVRGPKYKGRKRAPNLSVYVPSLHRARPFYSRLSRKEQKRVDRWYSAYFGRVYRLICAGKM